MNSNYSVRNFFSLLLSKIKLIILITFCAGLVAFTVTKTLIAPKYSSHMNFYVRIEKNSNLPNSEQDIVESKKLANTFIEVLLDDKVIEDVYAKLQSTDYKETYYISNDVLKNNFSFSSDNKVKTSSIKKCYSIRYKEDTNVINVEATTKDPYLSAALCNALFSESKPSTEKAINAGELQKTEDAFVYKIPVSPNLFSNTLIGLILGFIISVLVCLFLDAIDNTIKSTEILDKKYKKPIIGEVLQYSSEKKKKEKQVHPFKITDEETPFYITESFKTIRMNVIFSLSPFEKKILAVSSANPSEGKSILAANMSIALAEAGKKVLLIDADLRKNQQNKIFNVINEKGLSTLISKDSTMDESIKKDVVPNLDLICAGPLPPNPSELLGSAQMKIIVEELSSTYDYIIIDTPPINAVTDVLELSKVISGIVLAVRYEVTTNNSLDATMKKIEFSKIPVLGFVLNGIKKKAYRGSSYYHYYNYKYYQYFSEDDNNIQAPQVQR